MPKYKNIRIKKKGGGTRIQRVQVLASGKYKFVKNKRSSSKKSPSKKKTRTKKKSSGPSQKKKTGSGGMKTFHIAANLGVLAIPLALLLSAFLGGMDWRVMLGRLTAAYTAYNPITGAWEPDIAFANYGAIALGTLASKLAAKFGLNKLTYKGVNI